MTLITAKPATNSSSSSADELFSLIVQHRVQSTQIVMKLYTPTVNTKDIPWTYPFLKQYLPSILSSKCFNEENLPFATEVRRTEIGHLFEHILLEYLCQEKLMRGYERAIFSGNTKWNWDRDPWGMFHIFINMQLSDADLFPSALEKSTDLLRKIIRNETPEVFSPEVSYESNFPVAAIRSSE